MDELAFLHGQVQPVVLGHVDADADRDVIRPPIMSLKYSWYLYTCRSRSICCSPAQPVAPDVEPDACGVAGELAHPVQFGEHGVAVQAVTGGEVEVVGEPRARQVPLAQGIAALERRPVGQAGLTEDPADDPAEQVVALYVGSLRSNASACTRSSSRLITMGLQCRHSGYSIDLCLSCARLAAGSVVRALPRPDAPTARPRAVDLLDQELRHVVYKQGIPLVNPKFACPFHSLFFLSGPRGLCTSDDETRQEYEVIRSAALSPASRGRTTRRAQRPRSPSPS